MPDQEVMDKARYIFSNVILIRDRMLRAQRKSAFFAKKNGLDNLTLPQMHAVFAVQVRGEVTISQLAEALDVSPPSISVMVDRLVDKGVLERRHCKEDRRRVLVSISPKVEGLMKELEKSGMKVFIELLERLGPETTQKWLEVVGEIRQEIGLDAQGEGDRILPQYVDNKNS